MEKHLVSSLKEIANALKFLKRNLPEIIQEAVEDTSDSAVDFNKRQLRKGINSNGSEITPKLRNPSYARRKKGRGGQAPLGTPDLFNTGDYYKQLKAKTTTKTLEIVNSGSKDYFSDLDDKYKDNKGLTEKSQDEYAKRFVLPRVKEGIKRIFANV